jgi:glycosyltransferase involved in cell wall biosynthesis
MEVTIGIPFYNAEATLKKTIYSVINQTYANFELILIDDSSTDNSLEIASMFHNDSRVKILRNEINLGLSASLNKINELAKGDIIIRMDADDLMFPDRIQKIVEAFDNNRDCNIIGHSAIIVNENDQIVGFRRSPEYSTILECYFSTRFIHPSVAYRKSLVENNFYNSEFDGCEDHEFWFRIFPYSKVFIIEDPLIFYRESSKIKLGTFISRHLKMLVFYKRYKTSVVIIKFFKANIISCLKIICYTFMHPLGINKIFLFYRNTTISNEGKLKYEKIIKKIIKN